MNNLFKVLLLVSAIVLGFLCVRSILDPMEFEAEKQRRDNDVIQRLIDIRTAQVAYRSVTGSYTNNFDSLVSFLKNGKMPIVMKEGTLTDIQLSEGMTEEKALAILKKGKKDEIEKAGLVGFVRDTMYVNAGDTLFQGRLVLDSLPYVPNTKVRFELFTNELPTASNFFMKVFEAKTPFEVYLNGLNRQEIINLVDRARKLEKYPGLQVGSVNEANNNAGNWE